MPKSKVYLFDHSPHLRGEWDYERNIGTDPEKLGKGASEKYWWYCKGGHSHYQRVAHRVNGTQCGYCSGLRILPGFNDLETLYPEIAKEFDDSHYLAREVSPHSARRVYWWVCPKLHRYESSAYAKTVEKQGCPYCAGKKVLVGFNDLATAHPEICKYLVEPEDANKYTKGSKATILWSCDQGHQYMAQVQQKTREGREFTCPYCVRRRVLKGYNDLATTHPELAAELDDPHVQSTDITSGSGRPLQWKCASGHNWKTSPAHRTSELNMTGCPVCSGRVVWPGVNDLATISPVVAAQLDDPTYSAETLAHKSSKSVWWKCGTGHRWRATPASRHRQGVDVIHQCPVCTNRQILVGFNDINTTHPEIAKQLVDASLATKLTFGSGKRVEWICGEGHIWKASVSSRIGLSSDCPNCCHTATSKIEKKLRDALACKFDMVSKDHTYRLPVPYRKNKTMSVDIYFQYHGLKVVVEYDGEYFHRSVISQSRDFDKTSALLANGYVVVRVRERSNIHILPYIPIDSPRLYQLSVPYETDATNINRTADKIEEWLKKL